MQYINLIFKGFGLFLILDAILAIIFGEKYMLWGLEYTPDLYKSFIEYLSKLPPLLLLMIKLFEGIMGFIVLINGK